VREFPGGQRRIFREVIRSSEGKDKDFWRKWRGIIKVDDKGFRKK
jgi:hypothetical protein